MLFELNTPNGKSVGLNTFIRFSCDVSSILQGEQNNQLKFYYKEQSYLKMKLTKGIVYVISTRTYFEQNIFKIGFTKCIVKRLKQFNNTRTTEDHFFLCFKYDTISYKKLETLVHKALEPHKLKNELFQLPLSVIEDTIKKIINTRFFNHKDVIFDNACLHKLLWSKNTWLITLEDNLQVFMNDEKTIEYIKKWIEPYDSFNLYRFISGDYYQSLLNFLKTHFTESVWSEHKYIDLSSLLSVVSFESKCMNSLNNSMQNFKLEK